MAFAHFVLRPATATLEPPQRLPLLCGALGRFFTIVTLAIVAVVASGFMLMQSGFAGAAVDAMAGVALVMVAIYAYVRVSPYPQLRAAVAAGKWPEAAAALSRVRKAVAINLALGTLTIAIATFAR
jgi:uncharacterized membrane protein